MVNNGARRYRLYLLAPTFTEPTMKPTPFNMAHQILIPKFIGKTIVTAIVSYNRTKITLVLSGGKVYNIESSSKIKVTLVEPT